jgi:hypothetical protein
MNECVRGHENVQRNSNGDCRVCNIERAREWRVANQARSRANAKRWAQQNPDRVRASHYRSRYGVTLAEVSALGDLCAVCGTVEHLVVDHDHETGRVRGRLCRACNLGIGMLQDSPELLASAAQYLRRPAHV